MRKCIALAFFVLAQSIAGAAELPPTLDVLVDHVAEHGDFRDALVSRLQARSGWRIEEDSLPRARPCLSSTSRTALHVTFEPAIRDDRQTAEVELMDCAAWPVKAWSFTRPAGTFGSKQLAGDVLFAMRLWQHAEPSRFAALFDTGDAAARSTGCNPELSLVKSADGQLRALARAGGPAYTAGLRTNDIILRIDGRDWWEYGTYQSQQRAQDGKTHAYFLPSMMRTITVACSALS